MILGQLSTGKRMNLDPYLMPYTRQLKMDQGLNGTKTTKLTKTAYRTKGDKKFCNIKKEKIIRYPRIRRKTIDKYEKDGKRMYL